MARPFTCPGTPVEKLLNDRSYGALLYNFSVVLHAGHALLSRDGGKVVRAPQDIVQPALIVGLDHLTMMAMASVGAHQDRGALLLFSPRHFAETAERVAREAVDRATQMFGGAQLNGAGHG